MSPREFWSTNHPIHVVIYMVGFFTLLYTFGYAVYLLLVGAVFTIRTLIREWLNDDPEQLRLPWRAM